MFQHWPRLLVVLVMPPPRPLWTSHALVASLGPLASDSVALLPFALTVAAGEF